MMSAEIKTAEVVSYVRSCYMLLALATAVNASIKKVFGIE